MQTNPNINNVIQMANMFYISKLKKAGVSNVNELKTDEEKLFFEEIALQYLLAITPHKPQEGGTRYARLQSMTSDYVLQYTPAYCNQLTGSPYLVVLLDDVIIHTRVFNKTHPLSGLSAILDNTIGRVGYLNPPVQSPWTSDAQMQGYNRADYQYSRPFPQSGQYPIDNHPWRTDFPNGRMFHSHDFKDGSWRPILAESAPPWKAREEREKAQTATRKEKETKSSEESHSGEWTVEINRDVMKAFIPTGELSDRYVASLNDVGILRIYGVNGCDGSYGEKEHGMKVEMIVPIIDDLVDNNCDEVEELHDIILGYDEEFREMMTRAYGLNKLAGGNSVRLYRIKI